MKKISDICTVIAGQSPESKYYNTNGEGLPFFQGKADFGDLYPSIRVYCSNPIKTAEKDDILLSVRAPVGATNLAPCKVCIGRGLTAIRPSENINLRYLLYFFRYYELQLKQKGTGTTFNSITQAIVKNIELPVPSLEEQSRIVSRIEEMSSQLDSGIETLKQTKTQLAVYRQAVLKEAFSSITNGKQVTLSQCLVDKPRNGYSPKAVDYPTRYKNLTLTATTSGHFIDDCYKYIDIQIDDDSYLWVKHNDILIQRANTLEYVGTAVVYTGEDDKHVYPDLMMKCRTINDINPHYIVYQLQSQSTRQYYRRNATGTAGSMPKINQSVVMNTPIIITNSIEQNEIVKSIEAKFSVCDQIEKSIDIALQQAEALRQSILKKAFEENI